MRNFNKLTKFFILLIGTIALVLIWVTSVNAQLQLTERSKLVIDGIGPIRVGMTVEEASQSAGVRLVKSRTLPRPYCTYLEPLGGPKGMDFRVIEGRIARVDISNKWVTTIKGAKIGDTQERIFALYPGQIKVTKSTRSPEKNRYLTFVPKDAADKNYRLIFEIRHNRVTNLISGKLPEVEYPLEYCDC
jgi:hypothetical protein